MEQFIARATWVSPKMGTMSSARSETASPFSIWKSKFGSLSCSYALIFHKVNLVLIISNANKHGLHRNCFDVCVICLCVFLFVNLYMHVFHEWMCVWLRTLTCKRTCVYYYGFYCECLPHRCVCAHMKRTHWWRVFFSSLSSNSSETLPFSTVKNITCVGLSPDGGLAIVVDEGEKHHTTSSPIHL